MEGTLLPLTWQRDDGAGAEGLRDIPQAGELRAGPVLPAEVFSWTGRAARTSM